MIGSRMKSKNTEREKHWKKLPTTDECWSSMKRTMNTRFGKSYLIGFDSEINDQRVESQCYNNT